MDGECVAADDLLYSLAINGTENYTCLEWEGIELSLYSRSRLVHTQLLSDCIAIQS